MIHINLIFAMYINFYNVKGILKKVADNHTTKSIRYYNKSSH
jgi:hypothetical protein